MAALLLPSSRAAICSPFRFVKNHPALHFALLLLAFAIPARAADPLTVEERLRALEAKVGTLELENAALRQQLAAPPAPPPAPHATENHDRPPAPAPSLVVPRGNETRLTISGYMQMQAEFGGTGDARYAGAADRLYMRRARLGIAGDFPGNIDFRVEGEYGAGAIGAATGLKVQANEIFINWSRYPAANIRVGQLKTAYSTELLGTEYKGAIIERSLGAERIGDGRQLAAEATGDLFHQRVSYILLVGNGNGSNSSANDNSKFLTSAHVEAVVHDSPAAGHLLVGGGVLHSTDAAVTKLGPGFDSVPGGAIDNIFAGTREGWGLDASWHLGLFDFSTEMLQMHYRPVNRLPTASFNSRSWQMTAAYFIVPAFLQVGVRRAHFDPNTSLTGNSTESWWFGLNYYVKGDYMKIMADYLVSHAPDLPNDHGRFLTRFQIVY